MPQLGHGLSFLVGGARSGKSDLAVRAGQQWPGSVTFVATATAGDDDMADRIERHQAERPAHWELLESAMFGAADVASIGDGLVIVDCVTLLVANLMFADRSDAEILEHVGALGNALAERDGPTLVISNEVGLGVHPETELGRSYRDVLGRANRAVAAEAQASFFVVAGKVLPLRELDLSFGD